MIQSASIDTARQRLGMSASRANSIFSEYSKYNGGTLALRGQKSTGEFKAHADGRDYTVKFLRSSQHRGSDESAILFEALLLAELNAVSTSHFPRLVAVTEAPFYIKCRDPTWKVMVITDCFHEGTLEYALRHLQELDPNTDIWGIIHDVVLQIAYALHTMHRSLSVVHGSLRLTSVLVSKTWEIQLTEFETASHIEDRCVDYDDYAPVDLQALGMITTQAIEAVSTHNKRSRLHFAEERLCPDILVMVSSLINEVYPVGLRIEDIIGLLEEGDLPQTLTTNSGMMVPDSDCAVAPSHCEDNNSSESFELTLLSKKLDGALERIDVLEEKLREFIARPAGNLEELKHDDKSRAENRPEKLIPSRVDSPLYEVPKVPIVTISASGALALKQSLGSYMLTVNKAMSLSDKQTPHTGKTGSANIVDGGAIPFTSPIPSIKMAI